MSSGDVQRPIIPLCVLLYFCFGICNLYLSLAMVSGFPLQCAILLRYPECISPSLSETKVWRGAGHQVSCPAPSRTSLISASSVELCEVEVEFGRLRTLLKKRSEAF